MNSSAPEYEPDRRPIASRERAISKRAASWLVRRRVTPNSISITGMASGIAAGVALLLTARGEHASVCFFLSAALMQLRLLANMLDGMVAVEAGRASPVGELFNEVPDRVSDAAMLIGAGFALGSHPWLGFTAACLALFVAYVRAQGKVAGAHQEFCGPLAKPQRVFVMTVAAMLSGCAAISGQEDLLILTVGGFSGGIMAWALALVVVGTAATAVRRLARIAAALRKAAR